jgi:hypothetical protein
LFASGKKKSLPAPPCRSSHCEWIGLGVAWGGDSNAQLSVRTGIVTEWKKTAEADNSRLTCPQASTKFNLKSTIQEVIGHKKVGTTVIQTRVLKRGGKGVTTLRTAYPVGLQGVWASVRKLFKTPELRHSDVKTLKEEMLGITIQGALSGGKTKKRVCYHISDNVLN